VSIKLNIDGNADLEIKGVQYQVKPLSFRDTIKKKIMRLQLMLPVNEDDLASNMYNNLRTPEFRESLFSLMKYSLLVEEEPITDEQIRSLDWEMVDIGSYLRVVLEASGVDIFAKGTSPSSEEPDWNEFITFLMRDAHMDEKEILESPLLKNYSRYSSLMEKRNEDICAAYGISPDKLTERSQTESILGKTPNANNQMSRDEYFAMINR
jgi:hypothetical protein